MQQRHHVNTRQVSNGRVDGSQVERVMRANVVVFDLDHGVTRGVGQLGLDLGRVGGGPGLVSPSGDGTGVVNTTLKEDVVIREDGSEVVCRGLGLARQTEGVSDLEGRGHRDTFCEVGSGTIEQEVGEVGLYIAWQEGKKRGRCEHG